MWNRKSLYINTQIEDINSNDKILRLSLVSPTIWKYFYHTIIKNYDTLQLQNIHKRIIKILFPYGIYKLYILLYVQSFI